MSLYSVMLVDDEEEVIQIIMKKLDWASMGFQIVGYAHNGAEALELAEECQPDVVMTDIKMPYMDGLELSRRLKERYPSIRIIIFSGFDEFEYAKEAIRIEVEEYILKPIDAGELQELFGRDVYKRQAYGTGASLYRKRQGNGKDRRAVRYDPRVRKASWKTP